MKTKVTREAIRDLIKSTGKMVHWNKVFLYSIRKSMLLIEQDREDELIDLVIKDLSKEFSYLSDGEERRAEHITVKMFLRELDYYLDKRAVIDEAIAECEKLESKIERLKELRPIVRDIFEKLDDRIKALFELHDELMRLDGVASLNYQDYVDDFYPESVDALRDDPTFNPALEAYDLAREVNEMLY
jgi:hypothetical protein